MRLRSMVISLAAIPLVISLVAVVWIVRQNTAQLAQSQIAAVQPILTQARKDELRHFVKIAQGVVSDIRTRYANPQEAQKAALAVLRRMDFGEDNYLYVYDIHGLSLMHPRLSYLEGNNQLELRDQAGTPIIRNLIAAAQAGGGYVEYMWNRPSTGREETKMGYVELVPQWGWIIGTGLYTDNLRETQARITQATAQAVSHTLDQILLVASMALCAVAGGGMALNLYEQRSADEKLRAMARKVVLSQETERTRVARELHDGVSQLLVSVKFVFESALVQTERHSANAVSTLREGLEQMRGVMREVRRISHDLRPTLLNDLGLSSAIQQIAREFQERTGIEVSTQLDLLPQLPDGVATAVFRVAQEALGNVEKHAQAQHVWIELTYSEAGLALCLRDDGVGFDVEGTYRARRNGLGLTNMRERIETLGGRLEIQSQKGETQLLARLDATVLKL